MPTITKVGEITRGKLLDYIKSHGVPYGEYHTRDEIMSVIDDVLSYNEDEEINDDDLHDAILEHCDSSTPVYNADRAEWFVKNWTAYDEIADELGRDGMGNDIMQGIGVAYCLTLERDVTHAIDDAIESMQADHD